VVIHELIVSPGDEIRWLAPFAQAVAVSFPQTKQHLSRRARVEVTGNPIPPRQPIDPICAREHLGLDGERPVLLVMGGSQGSEAINRWAIRIWEDQSLSKRQQVQILHLAGLRGADEAEHAYHRLGMKGRVFPFFRQMHFAYAASSFAISRAGATTIAELVEYRLPAILIPYPYAGGHQRQNALWMQQQGGAVVIREEELSCQRLWEAVESLWGQPRRLGRMQAALGACANGSAVERLGELVRRVAG
jgi:UDP-N-acetylglucosamine--N-acetylmuramyl-(pentapeptide) pyrophosphoryl-undecaprenol N-acetylglucosamine transferase